MDVPYPNFCTTVKRIVPLSRCSVFRYVLSVTDLPFFISIILPNDRRWFCSAGYAGKDARERWYLCCLHVVGSSDQPILSRTNGLCFVRLLYKVSPLEECLQDVLCYNWMDCSVLKPNGLFLLWRYPAPTNVWQLNSTSKWLHIGMYI